MKIAILGGDGFVGWPTCLHLFERGPRDPHRGQPEPPLDRHRAGRAVADAHGLDPGALPHLEAGHGRPLHFHLLNLATEYERLKQWLAEHRPDAVIHFAEQRAAPYSMKTDRHKVYTVDNNVGATHHVLAALVETGIDAHLVHLGTMGVYGYSSVGAPIPEGYLDVTIDTPTGKRGQEILYPTRPGSVYHMTKSLDQILFQFYAQNDGAADHRPAPGHRLGHAHRPDAAPRPARQPLRLRRRLRDGAEPLPDPGGDRLSADRPRHRRPDPRLHPHPGLGPLHRAGARGRPQAGRAGPHLQPDDRDAPRPRPGATGGAADRRRGRVLPNPRKEAEENDLIVKNDQFLALGLNPIRLEEGLLAEVVDVAKRFAHRIDRSRVPAVSAWTKEIAAQVDRDPERRALRPAS